jgi:hypothetical protein
MARGKGSVAGAAASARVAKSTTSKAMTYLPPWLMWLSLPALALVFWVMTMPGKSAAMLIAAALAAGTGALAAFTWHVYSRRRDESVRVHATAFVTGCGIWVLAASTFGLFKRPNVDVWPEVWQVFSWLVHAFNGPVWAVWLVGGIGGCLTWSIRRVSIPPESSQQVGESKLEKVLAGARASKVRQIDGRVHAEIEVNRGEQSVKDLQSSRDHIAAVLEVRPEAVRITPNPDDAGRAEIVVVPEDPLAGEIAWPGPSAPGRSIADAPISLGLYEDGEVARAWLTGDDEQGRALPHWLIMGMNGAGKSQGWVVAMADALTRNDFELWGSDHVKGVQTFGPLVDYMSKVAASLKDAKAMIAAARDEVAKRQDDLGRRGLKQWEKGCGYSLLVVWIEEASEIVADSASFVRLVERARSAGVVIVTSLQRASHNNIDTDARAQLAAALCFGVRDGIDATFALPDPVLDAGASPDAWGNRKPGYCYLVAPGIAEERWAVTMRTYRARDPQILEVLQKWGTPMSTQPQTPRPANAPAEVEDEFYDGRQDDIAEDEGLEPMPPPLEPDLNVDPDQPIPGPPPEANLSFATARPGSRLNTEQAQAVVQQHLRTLLSGGQAFTRPVDVCRMKPQTTRSREWVRLELERLCTGAGEGEVSLERDVADPPGVFRIVAPVPSGV